MKAKVLTGGLQAQHYYEYEVSQGKASPVYPDTDNYDEDEHLHWHMFFGNQELYAPHIPDGKVSIYDVEFVDCELRLTTPSSNKAIESVEEAAEKSPSMLRENYYDQYEKRAYIDGARFGANWQKAQDNKEVITTIEAEIAQTRISILNNGNDEMEVIMIAELNCLTTLLATLNKK